MKENKSKFKVNKIFLFVVLNLFISFKFFYILHHLKIYKNLINFNYIYFFIFFIIKSNIIFFFLLNSWKIFLIE